LELYQTLLRISDPRWSCSTVEIRGSTTPELFFLSCSTPIHALSTDRSTPLATSRGVTLAIHIYVQALGSLAVHALMVSTMLKCRNWSSGPQESPQDQGVRVAVPLHHGAPVVGGVVPASLAIDRLRPPLARHS
jgi:hypothetical protein